MKNTLIWSKCFDACRWNHRLKGAIFVPSFISIAAVRNNDDGGFIGKITRNDTKPEDQILTELGWLSAAGDLNDQTRRGRKRPNDLGDGLHAGTVRREQRRTNWGRGEPHQYRAGTRSILGEPQPWAFGRWWIRRRAEEGWGEARLLPWTASTSPCNDLSERCKRACEGDPEQAPSSKTFGIRVSSTVKHRRI